MSTYEHPPCTAPTAAHEVGGAEQALSRLMPAMPAPGGTWKPVGECHIAELPAIVEIVFNLLSDMAAISHMWLLSTWYVAHVSKEVDFQFCGF